MPRRGACCSGDVPTVSGAIGEVQKRRDSVPELVPADSVGSIFAHEAIVIALSRAFFRAVEPEAERNNASRAVAGVSEALSRKTDRPQIESPGSPSMTCWRSTGRSPGFQSDAVWTTR